MDESPTPDEHADRRGSLKAIADLARAGVGRHDTVRTAVQFRVHHLADQPGAYRKVLQAETDHQFIETLTASANGVGLIVETYVDREAGDVRPLRDGRPCAEVTKDLRDDDDLFSRRVFAGVAQPNPSFLFEGTTVLELLVTVAPEVGPGDLQRYHGVAVHHLMAEIADLAAHDAHAPILSLQAPAMTPTSPDGWAGPGAGGESAATEEMWPPSSTLALRCSIAIGDITAEDRVAYVRRLEGYCRERGFGLWVGDLRPDHRSGNWFPILAPDLERMAERRRAATADNPSLDHAITKVLPLTLVGPARAGSTWATLEAFGRTSPAILASSITALDDLAFIHLQLGLTADDHDPGASADAEPEACPRPAPSLEDLGAALAVFGVEMSTQATVDAQLTGAPELAGYAALHGPVLPIRPPESCRPVWMSWEVDSSQAGLRDMILSLSRALDRLIAPAITAGRVSPSALEHLTTGWYPNIEYLISRDLGVGSVHAKGKLQIPDALLQELPQLDDRPWTNGGTDVALNLEALWLAELKQQDIHPRELRVAWREWWLGH